MLSLVQTIMVRVDSHGSKRASDDFSVDIGSHPYEELYQPRGAPTAATANSTPRRSMAEHQEAMDAPPRSSYFVSHNEGQSPTPSQQ